MGSEGPPSKATYRWMVGRVASETECVAGDQRGELADEAFLGDLGTGDMPSRKCLKHELSATMSLAWGERYEIEVNTGIPHPSVLLLDTFLEIPEGDLGKTANP